MAFDPQREDYQRMGLRFTHTLDTSDPSEVTRAFATFGRRFARERDSLPQSDADRAFHLVAQATRLIDYELPFATEQEAVQIIERGHQLLDEALSLDEKCYDALRMKAAADNPSFDSFYAFLGEHVEEVRRSCEDNRNAVLLNGTDDERTALEASLAMRPYLRWVATQAEQALICGRNREALRHVFVALDADSRDEADARFTASLAYAKLEDSQGLEQLINSDTAKLRMRPADDAWVLLARIAIAHKSCDYTAASETLNELIRLYPHAAETLVRQIELPDGVFARLSVKPYSEDELVLALSEATVLLQEGRDPEGRGVFGSWLANQAAQTLSPAVLQMLAAEAQAYAQGQGETR